MNSECSSLEQIDVLYPGTYSLNRYSKTTAKLFRYQKC